MKPANLLFDEEGRVRVADFGVARALAEAAWTEPAGAMIGTARYTSPEQAQGHAVDGRANVYSLALVLYESMTGTVPFVADTTVGTLMARVGAPLPRHPALGPLDEVLARAASPEVEVRLDAAAFATRLEAVAAGLGPAGPLPLAVTAAGTAVAPTVLADATAVAPAAEVFAVTGVADSVDQTVAAPVAGAATTGGTPPASTGRHSAGAGGPGGPAVRQRPRRPWWPWAVGAVGVVAVVLVILALTTDVFTPSHPVPDLVGKSLVQATSRGRSGWFQARGRDPGRLDERAERKGGLPGSEGGDLAQAGAVGDGAAVGRSAHRDRAVAVGDGLCEGGTGVDRGAPEGEVPRTSQRRARQSPPGRSSTGPTTASCCDLRPVGVDDHNRRLDGQAAGERPHSGRGNIVHS